MPSFVNAWLLENPYPLAIGLGAIAGAVAWRGLSLGSRAHLLVAALAALLGTAAVLVGRAVVTPGEHARAVVEELIACAEIAAVDDAATLFTPNAVMNYERRENQGVPIDAIRRALRTLQGVNRIESNRTTSLSCETLDADTGEVVFSCSTVVARSMGAVPTVWIARVRRGATPDAPWRIDRLTFRSLYGKPPTPMAFR